MAFAAIENKETFRHHWGVRKRLAEVPDKPGVAAEVLEKIAAEWGVAEPRHNPAIAILAVRGTGRKSFVICLTYLARADRIGSARGEISQNT